MRDLTDDELDAVADRVADRLDDQPATSGVSLTRRQLLTIAGGGSAAVAALMTLGVDRASAQQAAGQVGTSSEPVDVFASEVDAQSVSAGNASIGPEKREWGDRIDVWVVGGQSNAIGHGDSSQSPNLSKDVALRYYDETDLLALEDPITTYPDGVLADGSAWPSFAKRYYEMTGTPTAWASAAYGGSSITGSGRWADGGVSRQELVTITDDLMARLDAEGYNPRFRGILWNQGEADTSVDQATYESAFKDLLAYLKSNLNHGPFLFGVFEVGSGGNETIRRAQRSVVRETPEAAFMSGLAREFGSLHYNQTQYNAWGVDGAERLVSNDISVPRRGVRAHLSFNQAIDPFGVSGFQTVQIDSAMIDQYGQLDASQNAIIIENTGGYLVSASVELLSPGADTPVYAHIDKNGMGGTFVEGVSQSSVDDNHISAQVSAAFAYLEEGDKISVSMTHKAPEKKNARGAPTGTYLSVAPANAPQTTL